MSGLVYLDIAIGVIFLLLIFSLFASAIQEAISGLSGWRGNNLRRGVHWLVEGAVKAKSQDGDGKSDFDKIWASPLIASLHGPASAMGGLLPNSTGTRSPSYVPPEVFAKAVWAYVVKEKRIQYLTQAEIAKLEKSDNILDQRLAAVLRGVKGGAEEAEAAIADWYDHAMERVSGWYTRNTRMVLFWIGLSLAVATNTDPMRYASELRQNEVLRQEAVTKATQIAALKDLDEVREEMGIEQIAPGELKEMTAEIQKQTVALTKELQGLRANTGWGHCGAYDGSLGKVDAGAFSVACLAVTVYPSANVGGYTPNTEVEMPRRPYFGWLLLAFGVMLGSQFWFDLLKRFVSLRSAGVSFGDQVKAQTKGGGGG